MPRGSTLPR
ncbi:UNVERIFIED_CONTAM: hypothetical protein GTU68_006063 [Idotea baltica]|nr:hypothetical protein [Idotea baltica]